MWNNIRYIFLTAQRDSIFFGLTVAILFGCYISYFLGSAALSESEQMAQVYAAGISRIIVVVGLIIFIAFHIRRSFENREIDQMIVRPYSRERFIISYYLGFCAIALFFTLFTCLILYFMAIDLPGLLIWGVSLFLELLIIVALATTASLILRSAVVAVMTCLGFYILSRMSGFILVIVTKAGSYGIANDSFEQLSKLVPRLDFFAKTEWLIYGIKNYEDVYLFSAQAAIYIGLLLTVAVIDFKNKQF